MLSRRTRRRHLADQPDGERAGHRADQPVRARHRRLRGMGQWRNGIRRYAARPAGRRRRREPGSRPTNRPSPRRTGGCRTCGWAAPGRVLESLIPAVLEQRVSGMDCASRVARAGDQVRRARPRARASPHAGAAVRRRVAAHPVVGVPPRQRRPRPRPHDGRLCAARRLAGAAVGTPGGAGPQGADVPARRRGVDRRRDRAARVRRRRRAVGGRLPPGQGDRLEPARPVPSTTPRW